MTKILAPDILIWFQVLDVNQNLGGAEVFSLRLAQGLLNRGYRVTIIAAVQSWHKPFKNTIDFNNGNVPVIFFPLPKVRFLGSFIYLLFTSVYLLLYSSRTKVIHVNTVNLIALIVAFVSKTIGKRVVCRTMGGDMWLLDNLLRQNRPLLWLRLLALHSMDKIVSQSGESTATLVDLGINPKRIAQISNGVDTLHFEPIERDEKNIFRSELGILKQEPMICCVNKLRSLKRVDVILNAFALLLPQYPNARLMIIGDGELKSELEHMASSLGVLSRVQFVGNVKDTAKYLQASDVFVLASDKENQSNALIEAMACGLPVIATAVGGNKEIIQHDVNGILVPNSSAHDLSQAIERILSNDKMSARLGISARKSVIERYSIDFVVEQYLSLYNLPNVEIRDSALLGRK